MDNGEERSKDEGNGDDVAGFVSKTSSKSRDIPIVLGDGDVQRHVVTERRRKENFYGVPLTN